MGNVEYAECYAELANAIVLQAFKDYRKALFKLVQEPEEWKHRSYFAHVDLELTDKDVVVENVHLSDSLMQLSYNIVKNQSAKEK